MGLELSKVRVLFYASKYIGSELMKITLKQKQNLIIFSGVFLVVFLALATSLQYSPLEIVGMPYSLQAVIDVVTFPAVTITLFPSLFLTSVVFCNAPNSCPGLFDAHSFENGVIVILISIFSALLYGLLALLVVRLIRYIKTKVRK